MTHPGVPEWVWLIVAQPEDEIPPEDRARYDGYERGKAENALEVSRLLLQVAEARERQAQAIHEREEAVAEREAAEAQSEATRPLRINGLKAVDFIRRAYDLGDDCNGAGRFDLNDPVQTELRHIQGWIQMAQTDALDARKQPDA